MRAVAVGEMLEDLSVRYIFAVLRSLLHCCLRLDAPGGEGEGAEYQGDG